MFKRKNGYYKFYNKEGLSCRIKMELTFNNGPRRIHLIYKTKDEVEWTHHMPDRKFKSCQEVIHYLCKNLERNKIVFTVKGITTK